MWHVRRFLVEPLLCISELDEALGSAFSTGASMPMRFFNPFFLAPPCYRATGGSAKLYSYFRTCINYVAFPTVRRFPAAVRGSFPDDSRAPTLEADRGPGRDTKWFSHRPGLKKLVSLASGFYFGVFQSRVSFLDAGRKEKKKGRQTIYMCE